MTVIQRFGSALNLNVHFHALVIDGVYDVDARTGRLRFHRAKGIRTEDVERLILRISERCERWLSRQGGDPSEDQDSALPFLHGASVMGKAALGKRGGRRVRRVQTFAGRDYALPSKCASCMGYSLHAAVMIPRRDRAGLERLCRYVARPPLAQERLEEVSEGLYRLTLKSAWSDGTSSLLLDRMEVIGRLVSLIPPPRANQVLYHGIFAPRSRYRRQILPMYRCRKVSDSDGGLDGLRLTRKERGESRCVLLCPVRRTDGIAGGGDPSARHPEGARGSGALGARTRSAGRGDGVGIGVAEGRGSLDGGAFSAAWNCA